MATETAAATAAAGAAVAIEPQLHPLGLGIGWRRALAPAIDRREDLGFVELFAEHLDPRDPLPREVRALQGRGVQVVLHSTRLSLGSAEPVSRRELEGLARLAEATGACLVSDHVCFVRARGKEAGHMLPLPFCGAALEALCENVLAAQKLLPAPLALENIAALVAFPGSELSEPAFLSALFERTGALFLLDLANLHANALNHGYDPLDWLDLAPLTRLAYVHLAGGVTRGGLYHDTHLHPLPPGPLALLAALRRRVPVPGAMLERDGRFPPRAELFLELDAIARAA